MHSSVALNKQRMNGSGTRRALCVIRCLRAVIEVVCQPLWYCPIVFLWAQGANTRSVCFLWNKVDIFLMEEDEGFIARSIQNHKQPSLRLAWIRGRTFWRRLLCLLLCQMSLLVLIGKQNGSFLLRSERAWTKLDIQIQRTSPAYLTAKTNLISPSHCPMNS